MREGLKNEKAKEQGDPDHAKHGYLGQTYLYHKNIMAPDEIGMTPEGSLDALVKNVAGLVSYGQVLITGDGHANAKVNREERDEVLGDKFFMKTMGTCYPIKVDVNKKPISVEYTEGGPTGKTCTKPGTSIEDVKCDFIYYNVKEKPGDPDAKLVEWDGNKARHTENRYIYIDNLPTGAIPGLGTLKGMRGLIPGMIENLGAFNPMGLLNSITAPSVPPCVKLNMETIEFKDEGDNSADWHHKYGTDAHHVALSDVYDLKPCSFVVGGTVGKNPISDRESSECPKHSSETFKNLFNREKDDNTILKLKDKPIAKLFNMSFGLLMAYLLWKVLQKESRI